MVSHEFSHGREPAEGGPLVPLDRLDRDIVLQDAALRAEEAAQRRLLRPSRPTAPVDRLRRAYRSDLSGEVKRRQTPPIVRYGRPPIAAKCEISAYLSDDYNDLAVLIFVRRGPPFLSNRQY